MITDGGDVEISIVPRLEALNKGMVDAETQMRQRFGEISRTAGIAMTAVGGAITAGFGVSITMAADFEQAITNAASVTGKTGNEFEIARDKMGALAETLGQQTVFSASEAANAFYDLSSKGFDVAAMSVGELKPILDLAAATQTDLTRTTEITTSTLRGFNLQNQDTTRIADVMTKAIGATAANMDKLGTSMPIVSTASATLGVSLEETVAVLSRLYDKGIDASTAGTGLRNVMMDLTVGTPDLDKVLAELGLTHEDLDLKTVGVAGAFERMAAAGMTGEQAMAAFGKRNGTVAAAILDSTGSIRQLEADLKNAGGTASTVADQQLDTLGGQMELLKSAIESVMIPLGQMFIPMLTDLARTVAPIIAGMAEWIKGHETLAKVITYSVAGLSLFMAAAGPILIMLPSMASLLFMLGGASGFGAMAAGATAAATGMGVLTTAIGGASAALLALAAPTGLLVVGTALIVGMGAALIATANAYDQLADSERRLEEQNERANAQIEERGVALNRLAMSEMDQAEANAYRTDMERASLEGLARAWFEHFAGRQETEAEYTRIHGLLLNEGISAEEAAAAVSMGLADDKLEALMRADDTQTQALLESLGVRARAEQDANVTLANAAIEVANARQTAFIESAYNIAQRETEAAQHTASVWQRAWSWIQGLWGGGVQAPGPPAMEGYRHGGVVGLAGYATGGNVGIDMQAFRWNENGGEIAVAPVGTRVLPHAEAVMVARDAIASAMGGGGGGGGLTVNVHMPGMVVREKADLDYLLKGIGEAVASRVQVRGGRMATVRGY